MKKHVLFHLLLSTVLFSTAQNEDYFEWGIKAGMNISEITEYEGVPLLGVNVGIYDEFALSERIVLRSEIIFSTQGEAKKDNLPTINLQYINFPVLAKYYFTKKISVEAGIEMDYLLNAKNIILEHKKSKRFELSAAVGGNYRLTKKIELGLRYHFGLTKIAIVNNEDFYNSVTQFSLSYAF